MVGRHEFRMRKARKTERLPKVLEMARAAARGDYVALKKTGKLVLVVALDIFLTQFVAPLVQVVWVGVQCSRYAHAFTQTLKHNSARFAP